MKRNIVILNGSPRRKGNTAALVAAFTQGAEAAGHQVTTFFLEELDLHGCRGCFGGHSSQPCPCVQKDDMAKIYPAVKASDVVVLASPLYYWGFSGQLKLALDRLFALEEGEGNLLRGHGRASALLMAAEGNGFADALLYYDHLMEHLQWKNLGHVLAGGNWDVGDIQGKPELDQARALGASLGGGGALSPGLVVSGKKALRRMPEGLLAWGVIPVWPGRRCPSPTWRPGWA